jgi:hypothetical protein
MVRVVTKLGTCLLALLGLAACHRAAPVAVPEQEPPLLREGTESGRFTLMTGIYEDKNGAKTPVMLRLDSKSGRVWKLEDYPITRSEHITPENPLGYMKEKDGSYVKSPTWVRVNEMSETSRYK